MSPPSVGTCLSAKWNEIKQKPKQTVEWTYFVKEGLVQRRVLSLQLMDFLVELCLDVSALDLQVLEGVDASLHNLGQTETQDKLPSTPGNTDACLATMRLPEQRKMCSPASQTLPEDPGFLNS